MNKQDKKLQEEIIKKYSKIFFGKVPLKLYDKFLDILKK